MKILIIEDNELKLRHISEMLYENFSNIELMEAKSYHSGLQQLIDTNFNLVLLDMTLPTYDITLEESGGRPQHYAGRDILRQMKRRNIQCNVIVITQFDIFGEGVEKLTREALDSELRKEDFNNYLGMIYYNVVKEGWKDELNKIIRQNVENGV